MFVCEKEICCDIARITEFLTTFDIQLFYTDAKMIQCIRIILKHSLLYRPALYELSLAETSCIGTNISNVILTVVPCILILSKLFIYQLMRKRIALKRILKFTLKLLQHVSAQSPSSRSALFELAKVTVVKVIN